MGVNPIRVLVVEDDEDMTVLLEALLEDISISLTCVSSLKDALDHLIPGNTFQLILCDLSLPDSKTWDTLPTIFRVLGLPPVVAMTGWTDEVSLARIQKHPVAGILKKGNSSWCEELIPVLNKILGL